MAGDLQAFLTTLEALPAFEGVTFRGRTAEAEFLRPGQVAVVQGLLPTARNIDVATAGGTVPGVFAIMSLTGRNITAFSANRTEAEVVFLPGSMFGLAETIRVGTLDVHLVFEVIPGSTSSVSSELVTRFGEQMAEFLTGHGDLVEVESVAGKFQGDIA